MTAAEHERLSELLDRWEEAAERGEEISPAELCADSPELVDELTRQINALKAMDRQFKAETVRFGPDPGQPSAENHQTAASYGKLQVLAQGGLGIVYRAMDEGLHREVVLKFIHRQYARSMDHRAMFRREAEVTSRLDHPGIVPVYGIGESDDGRVFYVMRYIQGETLDEAIERLHTHGKPHSTASLELRNLLGRFVTICKTIAYAHDRGIIHRDIKPANIMLGRFGETLVVDWGLATPVGRDERFKQSGEKTLMPSDSGENTDSAAGTPIYMSPEATANAVLTPATDIYSLGATLYKLLTGKAAFDAASIQQLREKILSGNFPPPSQVKHGTSKALEAICRKAMAAKPIDRYSTGLELAADIENYLADEPVTAYQEPVPRRAARWARRHRVAAQVILIGVSVLAVITVAFAIWLGYLANSEHEARVAAEAAQKQSLRMSAKFAAKTIAGQIDLRWRILEAASKDQLIREILTKINASPQDITRREPAQAWLNSQFIQLQNDNGIDFSSMFLLDFPGTQVARAPRKDSIGESFAFRDYFHGRGRDLSADEMTGVEPIQNVNLSATYASSTSGKLKVAFTVPVVSVNANPQRVVGVLGMSVDLGDFGVLETDLQSGQIVVLVDSRSDSVDGPPRRGLILQHPRFDQEATEPLHARIDDESLRRIDTPDETFLLSDYDDPFFDETWMAAFESVIVEGRPSLIANTGWIVLVQEKTEKD